MPRHSKSDIARAMALMPGGMFVMTASAEGRKGAVLVKWVQPCSDNPPMVMVALSKGQHVEPLLRNSRSFVLCQISENDRFLLRKFGQNGRSGGNGGNAGNEGTGGQDASDEVDVEGEYPSHDEDPLVTMTTSLAPSGAPIVDRAMTYLDCEIIRHIELESDFRIYVGQVHAGALLNQGTPAIQFGGNGIAQPR